VTRDAGVAAADECTTAAVGPRAGEDGRPLLWKNRDTDVLSNRVVFVKETPYGYLGLADREGTLMADALRTCRTVADFEAYLKANLGRGLGARANFGVIDAEEYLNARRLDNRDGTGFLPRLLAVEDEIFDRTATCLSRIDALVVSHPHGDHTGGIP
jgi:hypothetical protein